MTMDEYSEGDTEIRIKKRKKERKRLSGGNIPVIEENSSPKKKKKSIHFKQEEDFITDELPSFSQKMWANSTELSDAYSPMKKHSPKKKKHKEVMDVEDVLEVHIGEESRDNEANQVQSGEEDYFGGWPKEDLQELFKRIESIIPKNDTLKYNSRVGKVDWEKVKFKNYSGEDCAEKWKFVEKKIRGYRILGELIDDAYKWLEKPWTNFYNSVRKNRHPDMPKRPLTSYMLFYMAKKKRYARKYPNLEMSKLSKIMAEKFNALPEEKREKYNALAAAKREEYNEAMKKFMEEHPLEAAKMMKKPTSTKANTVSGPKKPLTPFKMFFQDKIKQIDGVKTQADLHSIQVQCKEKWNSMSNRKKIPWIRWAHEAEVKYLEEVKIYAAENPDFKPPPYKSILSKLDKAILEKNDGKPDKPPNSAYSLFSRIMLKDPNLKEKFETPKERLQEIARLWREVPKVEKDEYADKVKHLLDDYKMEYATYLETLPEEKKEEELAALQPKKKNTEVQVQPSKSSKKYKQMTINSVLKKLVPESDVSSKKIKTLDELIKMEPVHPPEDPFALFKDEYLTNGLSEKKAVKAWVALSDVEKKKYEEKLDRLKHQYILDFQTFLSNMKSEELHTYSAYKGTAIKEAAAKDSDGSSEDSEADSESSGEDGNSDDS